MNVTLRLLLNLSFDPSLRQEIVKEAFLPKLTDLLGLIVVHTVGGLYLLSVSACVCGQIMRVKEKWCSPYFITSASMPRVVLCLPTLTAYQRCPNQIMAFQ